MLLFESEYFTDVETYKRTFKHLDFQTFIHFTGIEWSLVLWRWDKEYIERIHGEPFKFLFLPKMGLLGILAQNMKKV